MEGHFVERIWRTCELDIKILKILEWRKTCHQITLMLEMQILHYNHVVLGFYDDMGIFARETWIGYDFDFQHKSMSLKFIQLRLQEGMLLLFLMRLLKYMSIWDKLKIRRLASAFWYFIPLRKRIKWVNISVNWFPFQTFGQSNLFLF